MFRDRNGEPFFSVGAGRNALRLALVVAVLILAKWAWDTWVPRHYANDPLCIRDDHPSPCKRYADIPPPPQGSAVIDPTAGPRR